LFYLEKKDADYQYTKYVTYSGILQSYLKEDYHRIDNKFIKELQIGNYSLVLGQASKSDLMDEIEKMSHIKREHNPI
jgi:hypothetical protein